MDIKDLTLLTVSFNNNELTIMMLKSFLKQCNHCLPGDVVIVDNGNKIPVPQQIKHCIRVVDNFNHKLLPDEFQASRNHCAAIDFSLKHVVRTKWCLLVDNDILFKPELFDFLKNFDEKKYDAAGEIGWDVTPPNRLYPYFCLINVKKFNKQHLNYFDRNRIISKGMPGCKGNKYNKYDTGYSFYEDIKKTWKILNFNLSKVCIHLKGGMLKHKNVNEWLLSNKALW